MLNSTNTFYDGLGDSGEISSLPLQTIPESKKTKQWEKDCMDALEQIGLKQIRKNVEFRDYYRMIEGNVIEADYQPTPEVARDIVKLREEINLPTYIKHFDLIGMIINQIIGEFDNHQDKIRIDSIDEFSQNEYLRLKNQRIQKYIQEVFDLELQAALALDGFTLDASQFETPEQQQQYLQEVEKRKNEIIPLSHRQKTLSKNFKTRIVEWAEHVLEADRKRFTLSLLEKEELKDYLLTGRYFRHYRLGYDYYKPERWRVEEVFFSQDLDIKYPQDGEYVGRVYRTSASDILQKYGHLLTHNQQVKLMEDKSSKVGGHTTHETYDITNPTKRPVKAVQEPLAYTSLEMIEQYQDAFNTPLGETTVIEEDGSKTTVPTWMQGYNSNNGFLTNHSKYLRDDIDVRQDTYQVTEAYWRGYERVAYLYFRDERGIEDMTMVTDDLLTDFIKENNIKRLKTISIEEFEKDSELNTIAYTYVPKIYQGKKISNVTGVKGGDIYFDIKPLEYQIKGDTNSSVYDLKLPVGGIITSSFAKRIRPYQFVYNVAMNQITDLMEKELGMFYLMDINFLPSEFKDMGDSRDMLIELRDLAKEVGFIPTDMSKKNTQNANFAAAGMQKQAITYAEEIQYRIQLADRYKMLALEQIGLTPQRMGSPTKHETAEGIRQSVTSSYAQTDNIYSPFNEANRKTLELHLKVAQHAEKDGKDISVFYRKDDGDIATMHFSDDKFHLRQLGIIPVSDSKTRKNIEQLRTVLLQNNTMGSDMLEYAELFTADTMTELIEIGRRSRLARQEEENSKHQQQMQLLQQEAELEEQKQVTEFQREEVSKERDRQVDLEVARIRSIGALIDNNAEQGDIDKYVKILNQRENAEKNQRELDLKERELNHRMEEDKKSDSLREQELSLKIKELRTKMEEIKSKERIAKVNKN